MDTKTIIRVSVVDQSMKLVEKPVLASGGVNETRLVFDFCEKWDGFTCTAVFYVDEENPYQMLICEDGSCTLPHEVYADSGYFYFTVFGNKDDIRRTANTIRYRAYKGITSLGMMPSDPTPTVYEQILKRLDFNAPADEQVEKSVYAWLDEHPEATTTVEDGSITDEKLSDDLKDKIANAGSLKPLKAVIMGELFEQPENYLAWYQGCLKYDEEIGCPVGVISGKDAHTTGAGKCYFFKIDPKTGEVTLTVAGQYDDADTYGCFSQSFYIDNNGNYVFYAGMNEPSGWSEIEQRKYVSTDKGKTWAYTDVSGLAQPKGSVIKLKSGRLIGLMYNKANGNTRGKVIYSDDNGENWTEGYGFPDSTEVEIIELKDKLIAIGRRNLTYTAPLPAVLYFSDDEGLNWTSSVESKTITDMCNPCSGVYWEESEMLELFYCSRASRNGNTGTIYHAYAKLEDALNDNFTVEVIGESKQTAVGIDFGYCSTACDQKEKAWVIYYDAADSGSGVNLNLILADKTCVTLPVSNSTTSILNLWTAKQIRGEIDKVYRELNAKINQIIINNGGEVEDDLTGDMYITNGLFAHYDFTTLDNYDASTSKFTPVVGSGDAFVATEYNNMNGIGEGKTTTGSGIAFATTSGIELEDGSFTLEAVVKPNSNGCLDLHDSINFYNHKLKAAHNSVSGLVNTAYYGMTLDTGTYYYMVLVYNASDKKLQVYINGELKTTATPKEESIPMQKYVCTCGAWKTLRIYNRLLTDEELANNYKYCQNVGLI